MPFKLEHQRSIVVLCLGALALGVGLAGCDAEDGPASPPIASVGSTTISRAEYDAALHAAESSYARARGLAGKRYYVPPTFRLCIRDRTPAGRGAPAASEVRRECRTNYVRLKRTMLQSLIETRWIRQEAARQKLPALDRSPDLLRRALLRRALTAADAPPAPRQVRVYFQRFRTYFVQPERRDGIALAASTEKEARAARRALRHGAAWASIAQRYAVSGTPERFHDATRAELDPAVGEALFRTRPGSLAGPIPATSGWYVVETVRVTRGFRMTLEQSRPIIASFLRRRNAQEAVARYWKRVRLRGRRHTVCRTAALRVPHCLNGPRREFDADDGMGEIEASFPPLPPVAPRSAEG